MSKLQGTGKTRLAIALVAVVVSMVRRAARAVGTTRTYPDSSRATRASASSFVFERMPTPGQN